MQIHVVREAIYLRLLLLSSANRINRLVHIPRKALLHPPKGSLNIFRKARSHPPKGSITSPERLFHISRNSSSHPSKGSFSSSERLVLILRKACSHPPKVSFSSSERLVHIFRKARSHPPKPEGKQHNNTPFRLHMTRSDHLLTVTIVDPYYAPEEH